MDPAQFTSESLLASTFRDDYGLEREKLDSLYGKAKRHQWNAELDVEWARFEPDAYVLDPQADFLDERLVHPTDVG